MEPYAAFLHDAVMLYALALNKTLQESALMEHARLIADGKKIVKNMYGITFQGKMRLLIIHLYISYDMYNID